MRVVRAERWHKVELPQEAMASGLAGAARHCSACGSAQLSPHTETVLDGTTLTRYHIVRCGSCGYDLLEPVALTLASAS